MRIYPTTTLLCVFAISSVQCLDERIRDPPKEAIEPRSHFLALKSFMGRLSFPGNPCQKFSSAVSAIHNQQKLLRDLPQRDVEEYDDIAVSGSGEANEIGEFDAKYGSSTDSKRSKNKEFGERLEAALTPTESFEVESPLGLAEVSSPNPKEASVTRLITAFAICWNWMMTEFFLRVGLPTAVAVALSACIGSRTLGNRIFEQDTEHSEASEKVVTDCEKLKNEHSALRQRFAELNVVLARKDKDAEVLKLKIARAQNEHEDLTNLISQMEARATKSIEDTKRITNSSSLIQEEYVKRIMTLEEQLASAVKERNSARKNAITLYMANTSLRETLQQKAAEIDSLLIKIASADTKLAEKDRTISNFERLRDNLMAINADNAHELKQLDQKVSRKVAQLTADNEEIKLKASEYQEENMKLKFIIAELRHRAVPDEDEDDESEQDFNDNTFRSEPFIESENEEPEPSTPETFFDSFQSPQIRTNTEAETEDRSTFKSADGQLIFSEPA
ncbi:hypothetical protein SISNIDRAFT_491329 [Sistotremastrum niveocremeum HHB9708]|uniref:Uncharacterized protein n=2 Tax=Sistotremastraceae TaxID=3402574 RepID=A0A164MWH3_9AGAM|nr:hypothetical protein SISNIDRAFT_491329 [Sistotremastrum niveocremeum HHB9708]KZT32048.1 hypothetical protein SISSUDRAFT_1067239 [Sistotremastrum suecicum HHB10207 ss-3]